ncbi:MAG: carbohydrate kinase [Dehalococcoidia bacterium]|nr:carbohydrate kinase [Dehalococcoidia bacterium]MSQ35354.1 carbohydrate kinase [Dehalococcoidia bacterium]
MHEHEPLVLAIDTGTSSIKAGLYDTNAHPIPGTEARVPNAIRTAADGTAEQDAEPLARAVDEAVDGVLAAAGDRARYIAGVGLDSMASTFLGLDARGRVVTPVYLYSDTRAGPDVEQLRRELDEPAVYERTGCPQHVSYLPGRVRWLRRTQPALAAKVAAWCDVPTYLYRRWTGRRDIPCSHSIASWSGLLNRHTMKWDQDLLRHIGLDETLLPAVVPYSSPIAGLCPEYARRWPALKDTPFLLGVGDGFSANVGGGCASADRVALTIGTTAAMRAVVHGTPERVPPGLWAYRQHPDFTLVGGAFSEGGNVLLWAKDTLKLPPTEQWDETLSKLPPAAHGLNVLPFIAGERATGWSMNASGVIHGLRVSTTPVEILQACMEAIACRVSLVASLLLPELGAKPEIIATGGAITGSRYWLQLMADALQMPVKVSGEGQDTSRGTAILALHALRLWPGLDHVPPVISATFQPDPAKAGLYGDMAGRQKRLYGQVMGQPRFG